MHFVSFFPCLFAYLFIVVLGLNPWPPVGQASIYTIELYPKSGILPPEGLLGRLLLCLAGLCLPLTPGWGLLPSGDSGLLPFPWLVTLGSAASLLSELRFPLPPVINLLGRSIAAWGLENAVGMRVGMVSFGISGGFPSLCSNPDGWVTLGVFWKDHTMTSCVLLRSLSLCVQSYRATEQAALFNFSSLKQLW